MDSATMRRLVEGASALGVELDDPARSRLARYLELLRRWNARINLTRIVEEGEIVAKHFLDSLAVVPFLGGAATLVDVGSGAGFPGAVVSIARTDLAVTLVESIQKKCAFLDALRRELGLRLEVLPIRLEELSRRGRTFDVAVSRATLAPGEWVERGAGLVAPGGRLIVMLGRERPGLPSPPGFSPAALHPYRIEAADAAEGTQRALAILHRQPVSIG